MGIQSIPRLTAKVRQQILDQNNGRSITTYSEGKNYREERVYTIRNGQLFVKESGDTSWSDSRYSQERPASDEETHRFLYNHCWKLNLDGIK